MNNITSNNELLNILIGRVNVLNENGGSLLNNLTLPSYSIENEFNQFIEHMNIFTTNGNQIVDEDDTLLFFTTENVLYIDYTYLISEFTLRIGLPTDLSLMVALNWYNNRFRTYFTIYQMFYNNI